MTRPIVFLDIDGVLTSCKETPGSYLTHSLSEYGLSPSCVKALKQLLQKTNANVIISSSWRKVGYSKFGMLNGKNVPNPLVQLKKELGNKIIGLVDADCSKVEAVIRWLDSNDVEKFAILDDDRKENFQNELAYNIARHFYQTSFKTGLTASDLPAIASMLL